MGAIEELDTLPSGRVVARSGYQWHCIDNGQVNPLIDTVTSDKVPVNISLACSVRDSEVMGYCWMTDQLNTATARSEKDACSIRKVSNVRVALPCAHHGFAHSSECICLPNALLKEYLILNVMICCADHHSFQELSVKGSPCLPFRSRIVQHVFF